MKKLKNFFIAVWDYLTFPFDKKFRKFAEEELNSHYNEKDVEFFRSIGIETDLETLKNGGKKKD